MVHVFRLAVLAITGIVAADDLEPVDWAEIAAGPETAVDDGTPNAVLEAERDVIEALLQADIERHKREGLPDVRVDDFPVEVRAALREALDLKTSAIPPEMFYSARFQAILAPYLHLFESEGVVELDLEDAAVRDALGPYGILFNSPQVREAWLERPGDEAHLQAAAQSVLATLPRDVQRAVVTGFDVFVEPAVAEAEAESDAGAELLSTEDALARVSASSRQALTGYRHLLGNRGDLIHALSEMPPEAKCAAREYLRALLSY